MNAPHIHPEDLLDRARRGSLTAEEQRILDKHLAHCVVCRFELSLAPAFYTQIELGPADQALLDRAVARTVAAPWYAKRSPFGRRVSRRGWALMAAAVVVAAGSAAAYSQRARIAPPPAMSANGDGARDVVKAPAPEAKGTPAAEADVVVEPIEAPKASGIEAPVERRAPRHAQVQAQPAPAEIAKDSEACAEGFRSANQARRDGSAEKAIKLYRELRTICAGSTEELSSRVLMGRIYLDRLSDPEHALGAFDSYLATGATGPLREDALIGRALSLGKLNRRIEERSAWEALLRSYPDSIYAEKAKARLGELR